MKLLKHKNWKILTDFAWYPCMMSLLLDEAGFHLSLIHFCPSDVFYLPSQIPSTLLKVRSFCKFLLPYWKSGPSALLKITVLLEIRSLLHMKKTWRVLKKHENAYPPHRPTFWLVLKSNKIFIIWKTKLCKETGNWKKMFLWIFNGQGKPSFPQKIQVYIVPVNWFSQLNFLFSYFYIFF